jgi:hypothetical protein
MNRSELIRKYKQLVDDLGLPANAVVLTAGGALTILKLRKETDDLDVNIPERKFNELKRQFNTHFYGNVEVMPFNRDVDLHVYHGKKIMTIDGVTIPSIGELIELKTTLLDLPERTDAKKAQDRDDIARLKNILSLI